MASARRTSEKIPQRQLIYWFAMVVVALTAATQGVRAQDVTPPGGRCQQVGWQRESSKDEFLQKP